MDGLATSERSTTLFSVPQQRDESSRIRSTSATTFVGAVT